MLSCGSRHGPYYVCCSFVRLPVCLSRTGNELRNKMPVENQYRNVRRLWVAELTDVAIFISKGHAELGLGLCGAVDEYA